MHTISTSIPISWSSKNYSILYSILHITKYFPVTTVSWEFRAYGKTVRKQWSSSDIAFELFSFSPALFPPAPRSQSSFLYYDMYLLERCCSHIRLAGSYTTFIYYQPPQHLVFWLTWKIPPLFLPVEKFCILAAQQKNSFNDISNR